MLHELFFLREQLVVNAIQYPCFGIEIWPKMSKKCGCWCNYQGAKGMGSIRKGTTREGVGKLLLIHHDLLVLEDELAALLELYEPSIGCYRLWRTRDQRHDSILAEATKFASSYCTRASGAHKYFEFVNWAENSNTHKQLQLYN